MLWQENPVTQCFYYYLEQRIAYKKTAWGKGEFSHLDPQSGALLNAEAIGNVGAWQHLLDLEYEQLQGEM